MCFKRASANQSAEQGLSIWRLGYKDSSSNFSLPESEGHELSNGWSPLFQPGFWNGSLWKEPRQFPSVCSSHMAPHAARHRRKRRQGRKQRQRGLLTCLCQQFAAGARHTDSPGEATHSLGCAAKTQLLSGGARSIVSIGIEAAHCWGSPPHLSPYLAVVEVR